jgi:hypothetical protein
MKQLTHGIPVVVVGLDISPDIASLYTVVVRTQKRGVVLGRNHDA